jgi:hypothetical protein
MQLRQKQATHIFTGAAFFTVSLDLTRFNEDFFPIVLFFVGFVDFQKRAWRRDDARSSTSKTSTVLVFDQVFLSI